MAMSEAETAVRWEALKARAQKEGLRAECTATTHIQIKRGHETLIEVTTFLEAEAFLSGWEARKP